MSLMEKYGVEYDGKVYADGGRGWMGRECGPGERVDRERGWIGGV